MANGNGTHCYDEDHCGEDFDDRDLSDKSFRNFNLSLTSFVDAVVTGADFRNANLTGANLEKSVGLSAEKLGGTILLNAKLPPNIRGFEALGAISDTSKYIQTLFKITLAVCSFSLLTILSTRDENLILHNASTTTSLPFIQASVSIPQFAWVAPLIIFTIYIYLLCYLNDLWTQCSLVPAVFPDGTAADRKVYPTLLNCLIRKHFKNLDEDPPTYFQIIIAYLLIFGITLFSLAVFWLQFLKKHDAALTLFQTLLVSASFSLCFFFIDLAKRILGGTSTDPQAPRQTRWEAVRKVVVLCIILSFGLMGFAYATFDGHLDRLTKSLGVEPRFQVEIPDRLISTRPDSWTGSIDVEGQYDLVKGADLGGLDLRRANAFRAFLARCDLSKSDLRKATLQAANLRESNLEGANLSGADLMAANLRGANLRGTKLNGVIFKGKDTPANPLPYQGPADIQYAHFEDIRSSDFEVENVKNCNNYKLAYFNQDRIISLKLYPRDFNDNQIANWNHNQNLRIRNLRGYDFSGLRMENAELKFYNFEGAKFDGTQLRESRLQSSNLRKADLSNADLQEARLANADLREATFNEKTNLRGADLSGADVRGTDLTEALNFEPMQARGLIQNEETKLPVGFPRYEKPAPSR